MSELLSQMRLQRQEAAHREVERYSMDPAVQDDIKQVVLCPLPTHTAARLLSQLQLETNSSFSPAACFFYLGRPFKFPLPCYACSGQMCAASDMQLAVTASINK